MIQTKHTAGEWSVHKSQTSRTYLVLADDDLIVAADISCKADADMLAATQGLLASCVAMMKYMEDGFLVRNIKNDANKDWALKALEFVKDMNVMHSAIARATGQTPDKEAA